MRMLRNYIWTLHHNNNLEYLYSHTLKCYSHT